MSQASSLRFLSTASVKRPACRVIAALPRIPSRFGCCDHMDATPSTVGIQRLLEVATDPRAFMLQCRHEVILEFALEGHQYQTQDEDSTIGGSADGVRHERQCAICGRNTCLWIALSDCSDVHYGSLCQRWRWQSSSETTFKTVSCTSTPSSDTTFTYDPSSKQIQSVAKPGLCMRDGGRFVTGVSSLSLQPCIIAGGIAKHQQFTINEVNDHMFYGGVGIHSVHKAALRLGYDGTDVNFQLCRDWGMSKWFNLEFVEDTITPVAPVIVPTSSTQVSLQDILQNQVPFRLRSATQYNLCVTDKRGTGSRFGMYACDMFPSVDINPADKAFEYVAASKRLLSRNETDVCLRHDDVYGYPPATVDVHPCFSPQYHQMFNFDTLDNDTMAVKLRSDHNPELCLSFGQTTDTSYNVFMHFCTEENPNQVFILDDVDLPAIASGQGSVLADAPNDDCHPSLLHCKETSRSAMVLPCSTLEYIC